MAIVKLGDILANKPIYGSNQKGLEKGFYKYLTQSDLTTGIPSKYVNNIDNSWLNKGDLLISRAGSAGIPYYHNINEKYIFAGYLVKYPINNKIASTKFIYFWFLKNYKSVLQLAKSGSIMPTFNPNLAIKLKINLPDLEIQNKIISIIEPHEDLFRKYHSLIRIDSFEHCEEDLNKIISIIEPFEKLKNKIFIKSNKLFEIIRNIPKGVKTEIFKNFFTKVKHKQIIGKNKNIIDLSIINSKSLLIDKYNDFDNFFTNKFFAKKNSILISSIRPNLQKQIIVFEDTNYLGTLLNYEIINPRFQFIIPYLLLSNNFIKYQIKNSKGTKMPVVNSNDIEKYIFSFPEEKYWNLLSITFGYLIVQNKLNILLNKIIKNLIKIII